MIKFLHFIDRECLESTIVDGPYVFSTLGITSRRAVYLPSQYIGDHTGSHKITRGGDYV